MLVRNLNLEEHLAHQSTVILINRNGMGHADPELQTQLMQTYLRTMNESSSKPSEICFYAEGIHLVAEGSPVVYLLQLLADKGVKLTVCSTCLNFYGLTEKVAVGEKRTMVDIVDAQIQADKVITL